MLSMTGFGAAEARKGAVQLTVEVRSVNHRNLDIKIAMPREFARWESDLRRMVGNAVSRGRIDVYVARASAAKGRDVVLQKEVARAYVRAWRQLKKELGLAGDVELALLQGRADIFQQRSDAVNGTAEIATVKRLLSRALTAHASERKREGAHLQRDMRARMRELVRVRERLQKRASKLLPHLRQRLEARMGDLIGRLVEPARLAQEAALLAERSDVTEELVRLGSHLGSLSKLLSSTAPVGKRLDFLLQEIHRELNTVGSKAGDLETTQLVLDGKAAVEKLREQVQNVE